MPTRAEWVKRERAKFLFGEGDHRIAPHTHIEWPASAKVRCSGRLHTVVLTQRGQVVLPDHTPGDFKARKIMGVLSGDEHIRCLHAKESLIAAMKQKYWWITSGGGIPDGLVQAARSCAQAIEMSTPPRKGSKRAEEWDPFLHYTPLERYGQRVAGLASRLLGQSTFWEAGKKRFGVRATSSTGPYFTGPYLSGSMGRAVIELECQVDTFRWHRLYRMGAALVEGRFIYDLVKERSPTALEVMTARTEMRMIKRRVRNVARHTLAPVKALIVRSKSGRWVIHHYFEVEA